MTPAFETTRCAHCGCEITIARLGDGAPPLCALCGELDRQAREREQAQLEPARAAAHTGSSAPRSDRRDR